MQGQERTRPFIGRPMTVSGTLKDLDREALSGIRVIIHAERVSVFANFDDDWHSSLSAYQIEEVIIVIGNIRNAGPAFVSLENCTVASI